jgi:hypothetical protein
MSRFLLQPLNLTLGTPIRVRISSINTIGWSPVSPLNPATFRVQTIPLKPEQAPVRGALTNTNQVDLRWIEMLTESQNGGAAITSYEVNWDAGTAGQVWTELFGYTTALATPYYIATALTMGKRYRFKIRA